MMLVGTFVFNMKRFDVTWWGKTAAFLLMLTFPGFLMGESGMPIASAFTVVSWILGIPGIVLSVYTACAYVPLVVDGIRSGRQRA